MFFLNIKMTPAAMLGSWYFLTQFVAKPGQKKKLFSFLTRSYSGQNFVNLPAAMYGFPSGPSGNSTFTSTDGPAKSGMLTSISSSTPLIVIFTFTFLPTISLSSFPRYPYYLTAFSRSKGNNVVTPKSLPPIKERGFRLRIGYWVCLDR